MLLQEAGISSLKAVEILWLKGAGTDSSAVEVGDRSFINVCGRYAATTVEVDRLSLGFPCPVVASSMTFAIGPTINKA